MRVSDIPGLKLADLDTHHNVELLSKIQDLLLEMSVTFKDGLPLCANTQAGHADALLLVNSMMEELKKRLELDAAPGYAKAIGGVAIGVVTEHYREETSRKEWALLSKHADKKTGKRRVLYWFGKSNG